MKICKDCKYYEYGKCNCSHPLAPKHPITGKSNPFVLRSWLNFWRCGPFGRWWEAK